MSGKDSILEDLQFALLGAGAGAIQGVLILCVLDARDVLERAAPILILLGGALLLVTLLDMWRFLRPHAHQVGGALPQD